MAGLTGAGTGLDDMLGIGGLMSSMGGMRSKAGALWMVTAGVVALAVLVQTLTGGAGLLEVITWLTPGWGGPEWTLVACTVVLLVLLGLCCWSCMFGDDDLGSPWSLDLGMPGPFYRGGFSRNIAGSPPEPGATGLSNLGNTW
jgi:hypothetical protein